MSADFCRGDLAVLIGESLTINASGSIKFTGNYDTPCVVLGMCTEENLRDFELLSVWTTSGLFSTRSSRLRLL